MDTATRVKQSVDEPDTTEDTHVQVDWVKIQLDIAKHMTTLATGTIVLITTLMDKFPKPLTDVFPLETAIVLMFCCLLISVWFLHHVSFGGLRVPSRKDWGNVPPVIRLMVASMYAAFATSLGFLVLFAIKNLKNFK